MTNIIKIDIFPDLEFPCSTSKLKVNKNRFTTDLIVTGNYPPEYKIFNLDECYNFLERKLDSNVIDFTFIQNKKLIFLREDKIIEIFHKFNSFYKIKISNYGKQIERFSDSVYFSTRFDVQKLNFENGQITTVYESEFEINHFTISQNHGIMAISTGKSAISEKKTENDHENQNNSGALVFLDTRTDDVIKKIFPDQEIICSEYDENISIGYATSDSFNVLDLRSDRPNIIKQYSGIKQIKRHQKEWFIIDQANNFSHIDSKGEIDSFNCTEPITSFDMLDGIAFCSLENGRILSFKTDDKILPGWCTLHDAE
ncbi:WD40 repeat protein [Pseudoloma neurophilia]|uniref:WD40 repeat protein n=1 Tax=Pseudoloma neurophilia TaxID=146866 RepID=A0A0R0M614_9MICR|nr:WD40 repeat protein [Pseudoloma neurophilia]